MPSPHAVQAIRFTVNVTFKAVVPDGCPRAQGHFRLLDRAMRWEVWVRGFSERSEMTAGDNYSPLEGGDQEP